MCSGLHVNPLGDGTVQTSRAVAVARGCWMLQRGQHGTRALAGRSPNQLGGPVTE